MLKQLFKSKIVKQQSVKSTKPIKSGQITDDIINTNLSKILGYWIKSSGLKYWTKGLSDFIILHLFGELILTSKETMTLKSNHQYIFVKVILQSNSVLTVNKWNPQTKNGGKLLIKSLNQFVIHNNAKIDLDGKGYNGGLSCGSGESYNTPSVRQGAPSLGGGGGGGWCSFGGGAGYGTNGKSSTYSSQRKPNGDGGCTYGDKLLSVLHLGSGGGGLSGKGGDGGGAIKIECRKFINNGQISVNGTSGASTNCGLGSGGTIYIVCDEFIMDDNNNLNNNILACGGKNITTVEQRGGDGGDGRIRIDTNNVLSVKKSVNSKQIQPIPYVTQKTSVIK